MNAYYLITFNFLIMHSLIFELSNEKIKKQDHISCDSLYDDAVVLDHSDWVGDNLRTEERADAISSLQKLFCAFAEVDSSKESIKINALGNVASDYNRWLNEAMNDARKEGTEKELVDIQSIRWNLEKFHDSDFLFYINGRAQVSSDFVHDLACGYYGDHLYIGGIIDYHI